MKEKQDQLTRKNPKSKSCTPSGKLVVLPYMKGLSEATAHVVKMYDRTVSYMLANTIGQKLFKP